DERVLRQILGQLPLAHHPVDERKHRPLIAPDQLSERRVSPLLGQRNDIGVREIEEVEGWRHLAGWARCIVMPRTKLLQSMRARFANPGALPCFALSPRSTLSD